MKLQDDSQKIINYYTELLKDYEDKSILKIIIEFMNEWSLIVQSNSISENQLEIFEKAIKHTHEFVWHESGIRLIEAITLNNKIINIFENLLFDKNWKNRFHLSALIPYFNKEMKYKFLKILINDKSSKVREKISDNILFIQDKSLLSLLKERLKVEDNLNLQDSIRSTIKNFNKIKKDKDGSFYLEINT